LNNYILASRQILEPRGDCWDDRKIVFELAKRMGVELPWETVDAFNDWTLEEVGITFKALQKRKTQQLSFPVTYRKYEKKEARPASSFSMRKKTVINGF